MALALLLVLGQFGSRLFPESPSTEADAAMQEQVERLLERQIDINRASARELLAIPWLNPFLAHRIVSVRDSVGRFVSVEQVRQVPGMSQETFEALRPYLRIGGRRRGWTGSVVSRVGTDSAWGGARLRNFNRLELRSGRTRVVALTEKDRGEASLLDLLSAGAEFRPSRTRVTLGDFAAGVGQGLILSAPHWRSSLLDGPDRANPTVRLLSSAAEGSYLRGGAVEATAGRWNVCMLGSYAGRDARLNEDGTVARLVSSGVHDDSASIASRNAVYEATAGLAAGYRNDRAGAGFVVGYSRYTRSFAPADSVSSFTGRDLLVAGANATCRFAHYELGMEVAASAGSGLAGALALAGDWQDFDSRVAIRGRQARFFSPHKRWTSLTATRDRLDASGRLGWHHAGSRVSLSGNTYRDFELDSLPARLELRLAQELGRLDLALALGFRYEAEEERRRTSRAEIGASINNKTAVRFLLADIYPEQSHSRGTMAAVRLTRGLGFSDLGVAAARIAVSGTGVTVYLSEPGAGRIGSSYSASVSCWRLAAGCGVRAGKWLRLGLKAGCAWKPQAVIDGAAQLELASQ